MSEYTIEVLPGQGSGDLQYRAIISMLAEKGLPTKLVGRGDFKWSYWTETPLDDKIKDELGQIPGVRVMDW